MVVVRGLYLARHLFTSYISMETMNIGFEIRPALYNAEVSEEVEDVGKDRLQRKRGGKEKISETF